MRVGEKRQLDCSSSYHHLLCSSLSLNPRSFSVPSTLKACPCCRLRVQAQLCPQESRRESRSVLIGAYMRSIYAHMLTLPHPVFFIYVNIVHSPRYRVRPLSLSVHITPPRTCCFCLCPYVPVSSTSPLFSSGSGLSLGLRSQVRAPFICAADLGHVVGVHFRDPPLPMPTFAPPSIVIPQAPHFPTPTFTRTRGCPRHSYWRAPWGMKARLRKCECYVFCLRVQVRPSPASSRIFLFPCYCGLPGMWSLPWHDPLALCFATFMNQLFFVYPSYHHSLHPRFSLLHCYLVLARGEW